MTVTVTIIPPYNKQEETLLINYMERSYNDIKADSHDVEAHCKYSMVKLDGEITTRAYFRDYAKAVSFCKKYMRDSEEVVKVDDRTGLTNEQENWYSTIIKTKRSILGTPVNVKICPECGATLPEGTRKSYCDNKCRFRYNNRKQKLKKLQQPIDK